MYINWNIQKSSLILIQSHITFYWTKKGVRRFLKLELQRALMYDYGGQGGLQKCSLVSPLYYFKFICRCPLCTWICREKSVPRWSRGVDRPATKPPPTPASLQQRKSCLYTTWRIFQNFFGGFPKKYTFKLSLLLLRAQFC